MNKVIMLTLSILVLLSGCGKVSTDATALPSTATPVLPTQTAPPTPSPTGTLTPTPLPVIPDITATTDLSSLHFAVIPEQITLQEVPFITLDVYKFLLLRRASAVNMTWSVIGNEHIAASISNGEVTATSLDPAWYGSEPIRVEACEPNRACATQVILYSIMDKAAYSDVRVTFVGNAGFLITVGDKKVLIDAMFEGFPPGYEQPLMIQSLLLNAEPPFDNVDLILATHDHADHFSAEMVRQHMQNNSNAVFISTTQATSQLADFGDRVIAVDPVAGTPVNTEANGIQVEAIYLSHGTVPRGQIETYNNGYIVTINGIKIFHTGDNAALRDVVQYKLSEQNIDLAFIEHFYLRNSASRGILDINIGAKYVFPIHYKYTTPEYNREVVLFNYPDAVVFNQELENWIMPRIDE
jgi:L-ascorbate metabolism protein UlaG (beta-lactamase superfamily)